MKKSPQSKSVSKNTTPQKISPKKVTPKANKKDYKFNLGALGDLNQDDSYKIIKP